MDKDSYSKEVDVTGGSTTGQFSIHKANHKTIELAEFVFTTNLSLIGKMS